MADPVVWPDEFVNGNHRAYVYTEYDDSGNSQNQARCSCGWSDDQWREIEIRAWLVAGRHLGHWETLRCIMLLAGWDGWRYC